MTPTQPAVAAPQKPMTVDEYWDFVNLPENAERFFELHRGEVVEMSRPKTPHGIVCSRIAARLWAYADQCGAGYVTSNDAGVILSESPGTVVGPDVAYFTDHDRFDDVAPKWAETAPVLAVEVLSPGDKPAKVNVKVEAYLTAGVRVVWLVDHEERNVTVYRPGRSHTVLQADAEWSGEGDMPGFTCRVGDFFRMPGDRPIPPTPSQPQPPAA